MECMESEIRGEPPPPPAARDPSPLQEEAAEPALETFVKTPTLKAYLWLLVN